MIKRSIEQVADMIQVENEIASFKDLIIQGVSIDSRNIQPGNLFVPFKGENVDGHKYVEQALEKGAAASLWEKDVPNPPKDLPIIIVEDSLASLQTLATSYRNQLNLKVVGITGSNGKTTTKDMITSVLSQEFIVQKTEGNYNSHIGLPLTILGLKEETEIAVLEMGMSGFGEIEELSLIAQPDAAVITNIGESHLQELGSREGIAKAKLEIVLGLKENGLFVYFGDEPLLQNAVSQSEPYRIQTFGNRSTNTLYPTSVSQQSEGSIFTVNEQPELEFILPVLGQHNVNNALAAILIGREFGVSDTNIKEGLLSLKLTKMRTEMLEGPKESRYINDAYNASPTSMKAAIKLMSEIQGYSTKIVILGDMLELGPNEKEFHYDIGKQLNPSDIQYVFTYGPLSMETYRGATEQYADNHVFHFEDKDKLADSLIATLKGGELVLFKGSRGMKLEEVIERTQRK